MEVSAFSIHQIKDRIYIVRGHRVMLDRDLSLLYHVETKVLNQAVRRNLERLPPDFMFKLTEGRGKHSKYLPFVFTEQGVSMLSSGSAETKEN